jgi:Grx4 family monothiol glutaredoxin
MLPMKLLYFYTDSDQDAKTFLITVQAFAEKFSLDLEAIVAPEDERLEKYSVSSLPTTIFLLNDEEVGRVLGVNVKRLREVYEPVLSKKSLFDKLNALITSNALMIFIKGSPEAPRCGFTRQLLDLFRQYNITDYGHFDILSDESVRQGLKELSNWPTYPQIYLDGELLGGLDIVREQLTREGKLKT